MQFSELAIQDQELLQEALHARANAQAPYSGFSVGASVRSANGAVFSGCNVERCTLTQTTHAEQNAIDTMIRTIGPSKVDTLAVVAAAAGVVVETTPKENGVSLAKVAEIPGPCGHCLQIIWENCMGDASVRILALTRNGQTGIITIGDALPMRFGPTELKPPPP
jgi:cytidine deaminase